MEPGLHHQETLKAKEVATCSRLDSLLHYFLSAG